VTADGQVTQFGAVVRADSVQHLTPAGRRALLDYGVRTVVDLRRHNERERDAALDLAIDMVHVPLEMPEDEVMIRRVWRQGSDDEAGIRAAYSMQTERLARTLRVRSRPWPTRPREASSSTASPARTAPGSRARCSCGW